MAVRENNDYGKRVYLGISGNGTLYESSKEEREGFAPHVNESTGATSYWKEYYNGVDGYLTRLDIREVDFESFKAKYLNIYLTDDKETCVIKIPLMTQTGKMNRYVKALMKYMPNIDLSRKILIRPELRKQGDKYPPSGLFLYHVSDVEGGKDEIIKQYYKKGVNGWPDLVERKKMTGETYYDSEDQDTFAYKVLEEFIKKVEANAAKSGKGNPVDATTESSTMSSNERGNNNAPVNAPVQTAAGSDKFADSNDDLPF